MKQFLFLCAVAGSVCTAAPAQTLVTGSGLALRSLNSAVLNQNGYVGTYLDVPPGGATVNFTVNATEAAGSAPAPHMNIVVADSQFGFNVASTSATNYATGNVTLPAGKYFIRTERDSANNAGTSRAFTVNNLSVTTVGGSTATFANSSTNANALDAANTYINNYRKGSANVALNGPGGIPLLAGTQVPVDLKRHAFNFGTSVGGTNLSGVNNFLNNTTYSNFLRSHFNAITMGNAGKWAYNEATRDVVTMSAVDRLYQYAQDNSLRVRAHNMLWGDSQQPAWASTLLTNASNGNTTAKNDLRTEISERIDHYVGDGDADTTDGDRSQRYIEMDLLNEHAHQPKYWNVYGASGIADIFNEAKQAVTAANSQAKLYLNEYNVLQWSADEYSNWYREDIDELNTAGYGNVVSGVGVQYYVTKSASAEQYNPHSPARIHQILQNLSVTGLPISLTEFGVQNDGATVNDAANYLEDSMRLLFGSSNATGFFMWGFWANDVWDQAPLAVLVDANWNLTPAGVRYESLMSQWDTSGTFAVGSDGKINFTGFFGDYNIGSPSAYSNLTLAKGASNYAVNFTEAAPPPNWSFWNEANSGSWSAAGNWTVGPAANGVGQTAYFDNSATARSVTVDGPKTVGMLAFNSTGTYTLGGSTITLQGHADKAAIYLAAGSHSIATPLLLNDDLDVTVVPLNSTLTVTGALGAAGRSITKSGLGAAQFENIRAASLSIDAGTLRISQKTAANDPAGLSVLNLLSITDGVLDLTNNSMVIDYSGSPGSLEDDIRQLLFEGRITSSSASSTSKLGYGDIGAIDADSLLIKFTFAGDANLDGQVTISDLGDLASNWQATAATWRLGDFNYDGQVTISDLGDLASNWQAGVGTPLNMSFNEALAAVGLSGANVPEPNCLILLGLAATAAHWRRERAENKARKP